MIIIIRSKENSGLMIKETISKEEYDYFGENADPADEIYYDCI